MKAFVTYQQVIQEVFPVMCAVIVSFFIHIEGNELLTYEEKFPELETECFTRLREEILRAYAKIERPSMLHFFSETDLEPFLQQDISKIVTCENEKH